MRRSWPTGGCRAKNKQTDTISLLIELTVKKFDVGTDHFLILHNLIRLFIIFDKVGFNPLKPELNPICYLLALLGAYHFLHVRRIRVKSSTIRLLMSYIHGAPILDVSRSHTTTQHSR